MNRIRDMKERRKVRKQNNNHFYCLVETWNTAWSNSQNKEIGARSAKVQVKANKICKRNQLPDVECLYPYSSKKKRMSIPLFY